MSGIIHRSSRGTVEVFEEKGEKRIRRTVNAELPLYETLKNLKCGYLPEICSVDIGDGITVVTEEFIQGKDLSAANLDEKQVIRIMTQLCAALDFIHGLGIVHRDVKPSNILLCPNGSIRLIDFEAARLVCDGKDRDTRYLGTDGFAPPEQYGFSQTDPRADIYAAGQTMKVLLGSLSAKRKYAKIIGKCTALDPADRYQSAKALAAALADRRWKISAAALTSAALTVILLAAAVPKNVPAESVPDTAKLAVPEYTAALETTAVPETGSMTETTTVSETEAAAVSGSETTVPAETELVSERTVPYETESAAEATAIAETEITTEAATSAETNPAAAHTTVPKAENTAETEGSAPITAIPDGLPVSLSPKEYAASAENQKYYTRINTQSPAYVWVGDEQTGFKVADGNYVLKNTCLWIAMYCEDYIDNDILINGKAAAAVSSGGSSNFGIEYKIGIDESVIDITSRPTVSRKTTVRLEDSSVNAIYYVNGWTNGGYINNGDVVRYDTPILISCYKNLIVGHDITVNGKVLPVQTNGDNTYMVGFYTPDSKETVIGRVKRSKLTEYEKTNYVPVYFSSEVSVVEFPFGRGDHTTEFNIYYSSGALIAKGSTLRIYIKASDLRGKTLKINGDTVDMYINGDGDYITNYIIPDNAVSVDIALK